jgi:glycosyltransferase involved in cell wall biosynthesis
MQIVIAHSHLNPGGVTRIIESQIDSLTDEIISVVVGNSSNPESIIERGANLTIFEPLNYLENRFYPLEEANQMLNETFNYFKDLLSEESILHFHNLNLGKNPIVTYAVFLLARKGYKIFNHAHDFAEDRPENFQFLKDIIERSFRADLNQVLYPDLANYHFGVLNSFDSDRLISYGVKKERIHWIPNPVNFPVSEEFQNKSKAKTQVCNSLSLDINKLLVTYPVRVIKRKNIGELILLSEIYKETVNFVVTQPPKNPLEIELYNRWVNFCKKENINLTFEAGSKVNFEKLLVGSDYCITTSYKEGFGMVYLEPWLVKTPVVGRDIDFITKDFKADGFEFPALYRHILVDANGKDFKNLTIEEQMTQILNIKNDLKFKEKVIEQNPIFGLLFEKVPETIVEKNVSIIKNIYSLKGYGSKLQERYKILAG